MKAALPEGVADKPVEVWFTDEARVREFQDHREIYRDRPRLVSWPVKDPAQIRKLAPIADRLQCRDWLERPFQRNPTASATGA